MIAWLWNVVVGRFCNHIWEERGDGNITDSRGNVTGHVFYLTCKKCGDIKCKQF